LRAAVVNEHCSFQRSEIHIGFDKLHRRASSAACVIRLHREPHRPERCQDFSLHGKPSVNGVFRIEQRLLESSFERVIFFRSAGGFKDFPRNVFERTDTG
jgi:hypothetical protein